MSITSHYTIADAHTQADGRRRIVHVFVDHLLNQHRRAAIKVLAALTETEYAPLRASLVSVIEEELADNEMRHIVNNNLPVVPVHQTLNQFATRLREWYRISTNGETARLAKFILDKITLGEFTDTQVRNVFGLSAAQWTTKKASMETLVSKYIDVQNVVGD